MAASWANPTGGQVISGTANINTQPGTVTINQATSTAIINWQDFSIAAGELTRFQVPTSASATLNRVTGGNVSAIYGTLQSNGQLYLVNPNGIVVGASGVINTAGFVASTLSFSDSQFNAQGDMNFSGSSNAGVINQGTINASMGNVYLIATQVTNEGTITAPQGNVGLAAGSEVLLQQAGDQHLFVQAGGGATSQAAGVTNAGAIESATAELRAAGGNAYALAINNSGNIAATGIKTVNGQIYLTADGGNITNSGKISAQNSDGGGGTVVVNAQSTTGETQGTLLNSGIVAATATAKGSTGGTVQLLGDRVGVTDSGVVDVSGDAGGGTALIGGDEHGANAAVPDASNTYLGPDAQIIADALRTGDGGKVILWGNETTQVYGSISARGGTQSGNGGFVETSGASLQTMTIPDRSAPEGTPGTWLLDPTNITITDTGTTTNGFLAPFTSLGAGPYTLNQAQLLTALQGGNVTLNAGATGATGGTGNITWQQPGASAFNIGSLTNAPTLELDAPGTLQFSSITIKSVSGTGSLSLVLNSSTTLPTPGNVSISGSTIQLNGGSFTANGNGYVSSVNANSDPEAVHIKSSTINAQGGSISLTGTGGYDNPGSGLSGGAGVHLDGNVALQTTGSGNITIKGTFAQNIVSTTGIGGVGIDGTGDSIQAGSGAISITGIASAGTSGNSTTEGFDAGIIITDGTVIQAGNGGFINLSGNASGSTGIDFDNLGGGAVGIELAGNNLGTNLISVGTGGAITLSGMGGKIDTSFDTSQIGTGESAGVAIAGGNQITAGDNSTITITGHGGSAVSSSAFAGSATGVRIGGDPSDTVAVTVSVGTDGLSTTGGITITGSGGTNNTTNTAATSSTHVPDVEGVEVNSNSTISTTGASSIIMTGIGGTVTSGVNKVGDAIGVQVGSTSTAFPTLVTTSAGSGNITITGIAGTSPNLDLGVSVAGFGGESATVSSGAGQIDIIGTGGSTSTGSGTVVGFQVPSYGVTLVDDALLTTVSGLINVNGTSGSGVAGVIMEELPATGSFDPSPTLPQITTTGIVSGTIYLSGQTAADAIDVTGTISGFDVLMNSANINLTGATVTTTDPGIPGSSQGLEIGDFFNGSIGQINITNSTITGTSMEIGADVANTNIPTSQVNINDSAINLVLGTNPPGSQLNLEITGVAVTAGSPGVSITNGSSITAAGGSSGDDNVQIQGTGMVAAGSNAIGVLMNDSTVIVGSSGSPGDVYFEIDGQSDSGSSAAAPVTFGAASAFGIEITNGSTITSYSSGGVDIHGTVYADDANQAVGTLIDSSAVHIFNEHAQIKGTVKTEMITGSGGQIGAAYTVEGVKLNAATLTTSGAGSLKSSGIDVDGDVKDHVVATDNGNSAIAPSDYGVNIGGGSQISASGNTQIFFVPISVLANAGAAQSSSSQVATSVGISVSGGSTITNSGLGAIALDGLSGPDSDLTTGSNVVADGVDLTGTVVTPGVVAATGGGSIAIAGLGGAVGSSSNGFSRGINVQSADVTTNGGIIVVVAAAGSGGSTVNLAGLDLNSSSLETGTTGGTPISGGGTVPPLIMIFATDSTVVLNPTSGAVEFQAGSPNGYAIYEDANSSVTTGNLVMGDYEDLLTAYAPSSVSAGLTVAKFNTFLSSPVFASFVSANTINPSGVIDLESSLNNIAHLDSALVGGDGLFLDDNANLTVDPIGSSDNTNYEQIDGPSQGPVFIDATGDLTLTNVSPLTGTTNPQPVIAAGNQITLVTGGTFINDGGASALSTTNDASYVIYASDPGSVILNGLNPTPVFNTVFTGTVPSVSSNTVFLASAATSSPPVFGTSPTSSTQASNPLSGPDMGGPGDPTNPLTPITTTITQIGPISQAGQSPVLGDTGNTLTQNTNVVGGASGPATLQDQPPEQYLRRRFATLFGNAKADDLIAIIREDTKDGSTVNTGTVASKWASNTGLSKIVHIGEYAQVFQGLALPWVVDPLIFKLFEQQGSASVRNDLSQAALGTKGNGH